MGKLHKTILTILVLVFTLSISRVNAQVFRQFTKKKAFAEQYFYLNINLGYTNFWGDLSSIESETGLGKKLGIMKEPQFGTALNFGYQISSTVGLRFNFTAGYTRSSNEFIEYKGRFSDYSAQLTLDLTNLLHLNIIDNLNVYSFAGIGKMSHTADKKNIKAIVFPVGFGAMYSLTDKIAVTFESTLHYSGTDDLDTIGSVISPTFYKMDGVRYTSFGITFILGDSGRENKRGTNRGYHLF